MIQKFLKFSKVLKVKSPTRANNSDAGIDFYIPEFTEEFINEFKLKNEPTEKNSKVFFDKGSIYDNAINIPPHCRVNIPSGIHINLPENKALIAFNKSGVADKLGLCKMAEVIDSGYQGQIHISLVNTSNYSMVLTPNQKIVQFVLIDIDTSCMQEVDFKELYSEVSNRGTGGFGSTGN